MQKGNLIYLTVHLKKSETLWMSKNVLKSSQSWLSFDGLISFVFVLLLYLQYEELFFLSNLPRLQRFCGWSEYPYLLYANIKTVMTYVRARVLYSCITFYIYKFYCYFEMSNQILFLGHPWSYSYPKCSNLQQLFIFVTPKSHPKYKTFQISLHLKLCFWDSSKGLWKIKDVFFQTSKKEGDRHN